jgi:hypothetical protein
MHAQQQASTNAANKHLAVTRPVEATPVQADVSTGGCGPTGKEGMGSTSDPTTLNSGTGSTKSDSHMARKAPARATQPHHYRGQLNLFRQGF